MPVLPPNQQRQSTEGTQSNTDTSYIMQTDAQLMQEAATATENTVIRPSEYIAVDSINQLHGNINHRQTKYYVHISGSSESLLLEDKDILL